MFDLGTVIPTFSSRCQNRRWLKGLGVISDYSTFKRSSEDIQGHGWKRRHGAKLTPDTMSWTPAKAGGKTPSGRRSSGLPKFPRAHGNGSRERNARAMVLCCCSRRLRPEGKPAGPWFLVVLGQAASELDGFNRGDGISRRAERDEGCEGWSRRNEAERAKRVMNWGNRKGKAGGAARKHRCTGSVCTGSVCTGCCCGRAAVLGEAEGAGSTLASPNVPRNATPTPAFTRLLVATSNSFLSGKGSVGTQRDPESQGDGASSRRSGVHGVRGGEQRNRAAG